MWRTVELNHLPTSNWHRRIHRIEQSKWKRHEICQLTPVICRLGVVQRISTSPPDTSLRKAR